MRHSRRVGGATAAAVIVGLCALAGCSSSLQLGVHHGRRQRRVGRVRIGQGVLES